VISTVRFSTVLRDFDPYANFMVDFTVEFEFGFSTVYSFEFTAFDGPKV
jgi:hypothetical protein